jgi:hypothetical protein
VYANRLPSTQVKVMQWNMVCLVQRKLLICRTRIEYMVCGRCVLEHLIMMASQGEQLKRRCSRMIRCAIVRVMCPSLDAQTVFVKLAQSKPMSSVVKPLCMSTVIVASHSIVVTQV